MDQICAITSFPKSGNTWMRSILSALFDAKPLAMYIPDVYKDKLYGGSVASPSGTFMFVKSHAATFDLLQRKCPRPFTHTIYILRHPLDVFCSQLNFISENVTGGAKDFSDVPCDNADAILARGHIGHFLSAFILYGTLQPWFREAGSWFRSAEHWLGRAATEGDVTVIRYEDLMLQPEEAVKPLGVLFGLPVPDILAAMGQAEKATKANGHFFWKKSMQTYKAYLSADQMEGFRAIHGARCAALGYVI